MTRSAGVLTAALLVPLLGGACAAERAAGPSLASVPDAPRHTIRLVCTSTIPPGAPALLVVNGEVWGTTAALGDSVAARLDPRQIEHVEVLKGTAAIHRYGEDARHGAIIIRTRTAGAGAARDGEHQLNDETFEQLDAVLADESPRGDSPG